jgi:hypothetical protein
MSIPPTKDPMAQLDAAMNETFTELAQQGRGTSDSEVTQQAPRRRASRRQEGVEGEAPPTRRRQGPDPAAAILEEAEEVDDTSAPRQRRGAPQRDQRGRFLPSDADTDDQDEDDFEADEDEEPTPSRAGGRRYAETDEADVDDDDVESEGRARADDDEDEDRSTPSRGRRRYPRAVRQEIDRQVKAQVERVLAENNKLREQQQQLQVTEGEALQFLVKAVGTQEQRAQLQAQVNNTRLPLQQRNQAAAVLNRYLSNEKYARTYRTALVATIRQEQLNQRRAGMEALGKYAIQLDPTIMAGEDMTALLTHVAKASIDAYRRSRRTNRDVEKRQSATRRGLADERAVRGGQFGRDSLASSNGRRANGRVATNPDRLRRAMTNGRGLGANSTLPGPTEEVLAQLRNGEITFADLGFGQR